MSAEQEISGAERDTMRRELNYRVRSGRPIGFEQGWRACLEYDRDGATAERQRADMAEEREKKLMKTLADIIESGEGNTAIGTLQCSPAGLATYAKRALEDIYA